MMNEDNVNPMATENDKEDLEAIANVFNDTVKLM